MADTTGTERILNRLRGRAALWTFSALVPALLLALACVANRGGGAGRARFATMSTPWGRPCFFFERWRSADPGWLCSARLLLPRVWRSTGSIWPRIVKCADVQVGR